MALDTYLVVFHRFDTHSLQKLERYYISLITLLTFIPALVFLFIRTAIKGPIYGSETVIAFYFLEDLQWSNMKLIDFDRYGALYLQIGC